MFAGKLEFWEPALCAVLLPARLNKILFNLHIESNILTNTHCVPKLAKYVDKVSCFFAFRNCWIVWLCFVFWVVTHLHCKEPSIHRIWMNSLVHIRIHPATSLCSHIIKNTTGPVPLADTHAHTITLSPLCLPDDGIYFSS